MDDINKLWQLQQYTNSYLAIKRKLKKLSMKDDIKKIEHELNNKERELQEIEENIKINEKILHKNNLVLKDYEYRLKKVEKSLYEDNISDLKQLSFLDKERNELVKDIEEKETEILNTMDEIEKLKEQFDEVAKDIDKLKQSYNKAVEEYNVLIEKLNKKAEETLKIINSIASTVDVNLYQKFKELNKTKGTAVVGVVDNRCEGCNMVLPLVILDKLKKKDEIVYCENCHRILYLNTEDKIYEKE